jgi:hypothetical protein
MILANTYNEFEDWILNLNYKASLSDVMQTYSYLTIEDLIYLDVMQDFMFRQLESKR